MQGRSTRGRRGPCAARPGSVRRGRQACVRSASGRVGAVEAWTGAGRRQGTAGGGGCVARATVDCNAVAGRKARAMVDRVAVAGGVWGCGQKRALQRERESGRRHPGAGPGRSAGRGQRRGGGAGSMRTELGPHMWSTSGPAPNGVRNGNQMSNHKNTQPLTIHVATVFPGPPCVYACSAQEPMAPISQPGRWRIGATHGPCVRRGTPRD